MLNTYMEGIFEREDGSYYWLDCMSDDEANAAKYICYHHAACHTCQKTILNDDMTDYIDLLQHEENLLDDELYVVNYHQPFMDCGFWNLDNCVDFGITRQEIIENVKNQKYVEGATYYTIGQVFYDTRKFMEGEYND